MNAPPAVDAIAASDSPALRRPRRLRRALLWSALVVLLVVAQSALVWLTVNFEGVRAQEQAEAASSAAAADVRQRISRDLQSLQALLWNDPGLPQWRADATGLMRERHELIRTERRDARMQVREAVDSPFMPPLFTRIRRDEIDLETTAACATALRQAAPAFSRSYFVPLPGGLGVEVMDICVPVQHAGQAEGFMVGTLSLGSLLTEAIGQDLLRTHELSFVEGDGTRLARAGLPRGAGVYVSERVIDLAGLSLQLRLDSAAGSPRLIPKIGRAHV